MAVTYGTHLANKCRLSENLEVVLSSTEIFPASHPRFSKADIEFVLCNRRLTTQSCRSAPTR